MPGVISKLRARKYFPGKLKMACRTLEFSVDESAEGPLRFHLLANTGEPMDGSCVGSPYPVIVEMGGVKFAQPTTPILAEHDDERRIGHTIEQSIDGSRIVAKGIVSSDSQDAISFAFEARNKFPHQVSLGGDATNGYFVPEGRTVRVNNQTWPGPLLVASKMTIDELTITTFGADRNTSVSIAASASKRSITVKKEFAAHIESLGLDADALDEKQIGKLEASWKKSSDLEARLAVLDLEAKRKATDAAMAGGPNGDAGEVKRMEARRKREADEDDRVDAIKLTAKRFASEYEVDKVDVDGKPITLKSARAKAIRDGWPLDKFELLCHRSAMTPPEGSGPAIHTHNAGFDSPELESQATEIALMRAHGKIPMRAKAVDGSEWGLEPWYSEQAMEASHKMPNSTDLHYLMDCSIRASGGYFQGSRRSEEFVDAFFDATRKMRAAGLGTHQLANILENVAHKTLDAGYMQQGTIWHLIAGTKSLDDFKPHAAYRLDTSGGYAKIGPDGVLPHAHLADSKTTVTADTWGQILVIGRKQMRNDDLGALQEAALLLGVNAALCLEEVIVGYLMSNRSSWTAGGASDMDIAGITASEVVFRKQLDAKKSPILVPPDRLVVGVGDSVTAKDLFGKSNLLATGVGSSAERSFAENPHVGKYNPWASPYLDNTAIRKQSDGKSLSNQNSDQWYMLCDPKVLAGIVVGFLDGNQKPTVKSDSMPFENIGGIRFKIYHDWGIAEGNTKAIVYNAGA